MHTREEVTTAAAAPSAVGSPRHSPQWDQYNGGG